VRPFGFTCPSAPAASRPATSPSTPSRPHAIARAVAQARARAQALAAAAGLTLGDIQAVSEIDQNTEEGFRERYCFARQHPRCKPPLFATATVSVTFATAQTAAAAPNGRALVATGLGDARVRPRNRRNSASIRHALLAARLGAAPAALTDANRDAASFAAAAGTGRGALFSIAEVRRPYDELAGSFGPGRYCGTVHRAIFRRDPVTGRRTRVATRPERGCFFSSTSSVTLRVTYVP
jgi:hypothetical protein